MVSDRIRFPLNALDRTRRSYVSVNLLKLISCIIVPTPRRCITSFNQIILSLPAENPLRCTCESQELWEWLRDHQKLVGGVGGGRGRGRNGVGVGDVEGGLLRCQQPPELRGLVFLDLDPHAFCSAPLILKLAIQDIQPFSVLVSWQSRNHSGLHGYQVAYHVLDNVEEVSFIRVKK